MSEWTVPEDRPEYAAAVDAALARLDLETKAALLGGRDMWRTVAVPEAGLRSMTVSDGPIGVRGRFWTVADPSLALPSPTAQAASWDPELVRRIGHLLAAESRRKDVDVLLAPTINLQRSPLGGRHFEAFSEDPYLTGRIAQAYVAGVQEHGVGTTMKHYVANDAETDRFTVDNIVDERTLRELYLRPFEMVTEAVRPWGVMTAYNAVNSTTMSANRELMELLRGEFGFDGFNVSDWGAARHTVEDVEAGLDLAMPGPFTVYGEHLVAAVREGRAAESDVDAAVRRLLVLAARVGALEGVPAAAEAPSESPDAAALLREIARRSFVLVKNDVPAGADAPALPLAEAAIGRLALIGPAAAEARILGGGSATVFPERVVSPLDGLREALGDRVVYAQGVDLYEQILAARHGFDLAVRPVLRDGTEGPAQPLASGDVKWMGYVPGDVDPEDFDHAVVEGTFTVRTTGEHAFGTRGTGRHVLSVDGHVVFDGDQEVVGEDPFEAFFGPGVERAKVFLEAGSTVAVRLEYTPVSAFPAGFPPSILFGLMHTEPRPDEDRLIAEAVAAARGSDVAVVVVSTTALTESEGFDRRDLRLPGRQDELVAAVAEANPNTVVVVNTGSPVEMPWAAEAAAVLLTWFPGQEGGGALTEVLLGAEPGGRLTTTWPKTLADAPVTRVVPDEAGELHYDEGIYIGYRAWERRGGPAPAYWFGHGLSYTEWAYEDLSVEGRTVRVRVRNTGARTGREVVQVYLAPPEGAEVEGGVEAHRLAGFAAVEAAPGEAVEIEVALEERSFQVWNGGWRTVPGTWTAAVGRSVADLRLSAPVQA